MNSIDEVSIDIEEIPLAYKFNDRSVSSDNSKRTEEQYSEKNEAFLQNIQNMCLDKSKLHSNESHRTKKLNFYLAVPTYSIPLILINLNIFIIPFIYINPIGLSIVSILNGVSSMKNYSGLSEIHNTYAGKYNDLADDINKILVRKKIHRQPFDVVLEQITLKYLNLNQSAPSI